MGWLRRYLDKPRGPLCRCPVDGELFYARGVFDVAHRETLDGVACVGEGVEVPDSEIPAGLTSRP